MIKISQSENFLNFEWPLNSVESANKQAKKFACYLNFHEIQLVKYCQDVFYDYPNNQELWL